MRLDVDAVERAVDRPRRDDVLAQVLRPRSSTREVERLDVSALGEVRDRARLGDGREVRRVAALERGREARDELVTGRLIRDVDVRIGLAEAVEDVLDRLLLRPHPDAHERDRAADVLAALDGFAAVVPSAARGDDRECEDEPRKESDE